MAHFAELDENNKVLNVLVVSNKVAVEDGSLQAENWCNAHLPKLKKERLGTNFTTNLEEGLQVKIALMILQEIFLFFQNHTTLGLKI